MTYRNMTTDEFLTFFEDEFSKARMDARGVPIDVVGEAMVRLMEMERDLLNIKAIVEIYDE